jgi:hypothetical protein
VIAAFKHLFFALVSGFFIGYVRSFTASLTSMDPKSIVQIAVLLCCFVIHFFEHDLLYLEAERRVARTRTRMHMHMHLCTFLAFLIVRLLSSVRALPSQRISSAVVYMTHMHRLALLPKKGSNKNQNTLGQKQ